MYTSLYCVQPLISCPRNSLAPASVATPAGVGIVSPQWVLQSLRSGRQQRCLTVSADASRHLPAAAAAGASASAGGASSEGSPVCEARADARQQLPVELLSREGRQQMLSQLAGSGTASGAASPGSGAVSAHQQAPTPAELLGGVLWSVLEPPSAARLEGQRMAQGPLPADEG